MSSVLESLLDELPPFPATGLRMAQALAGDEDKIDIEEVVDLIRSDPALTADMLRRANSPLYGFKSRIDSVQQCLVLLGFQEVRQVALALSTRRFAGEALKRPELARCWASSLACAVLAERIAAAVGVSTDRAYTAGLMQDIGRLSLFTAWPEQYAALVRRVEAQPPADDTSGFLDVERDTFGCDHCEAGAWLAARWGLPEDLQAIAGRHHDRPEGRPIDLLEVVQFAVRGADAIGLGIAPVVPPDTLGQVFAGLPDDAVTELASSPARLAEEVRERAARLQYEPPAKDSVAAAEEEPEAPEPRSDYVFALAGAVGVVLAVAALFLWTQ